TFARALPSQGPRDAQTAMRQAREREVSELEDLRQALHACEAQRSLLAEMLDGTDAFVQVADLDFRWLAVNRASANEFERIFGIRPQVGDSMLDILADQPEQREAVRRVWERALLGEEFVEVASFGAPGRARRLYEMHFRPLRDEAGERIGAYQFVYDV